MRRSISQRTKRREVARIPGGCSSLAKGATKTWTKGGALAQSAAARKGSLLEKRVRVNGRKEKKRERRGERGQNRQKPTILCRYQVIAGVTFSLKAKLGPRDSKKKVIFATTH